MSLQQALHLVPAFVLVFSRLAGMMLAAPFFGGARIPVRIKAMFALVLAAGLLPGIAAPTELPATVWELAVGMGGELLFGLAIGTALSFTFVAVHWAGQMIGQQMGLGLGEMFDPQSESGSVVGDMYFLLALVIFLTVQGHHAFLRGVRATFDSLPLLSATIGPDLLALVTGLLHASTAVALQLAAPIVVTMLVTDVVLGFLSKTVPQINVMTAGLSIRAVVGLMVLILGVTLSSELISESLLECMDELGGVFYSGGAA